MKRLSLMLLVLVIIIGTVGCNEKKQEEIQVGFGKVDITPDNGVALGAFGNDSSRLTKGVLTSLYALSLVITDQDDNTFVLVVSDVVYSTPRITNMVRVAINKEYGIPKENIVDAGTHNHNGPSVGYDSDANNAYWEQYAEAVTKSVGKALEDRQVATMEIGRTATENLTFSRRYVREDGNYVGGGPDKWNVPSTSPIVAHETEADEEIQMVRFIREGKDILLTNWQAHACNIDADRNKDPHYMASADWPGIMRDAVENELGVHCMYIQGAAGNLTAGSRIEGEFAVEDQYDFQGIGQMLADYVVKAYNNTDTFKEIKSGMLQIDQQELSVPSKEGENASDKPEVNTIAVGDLSFVTLAPELFDTEAKALKEATPFAMTLIVGYAAHNGSYVAPEWAYEHGCYEVENTTYGKGSSEIIFEHYSETLKTLKQAQ